ncbi:MAG: BlaI/MecI/CopY family transcriptional regulator [Armatimonadetes bacterium]|nr:BlaI/MecI/CopY family transcriptional regulator [Armatimonadota bacterium]
MSEPPVHTFRLQGRRLGRVLGDLEAEVMEVLWRKGQGSIREVWDELRSKRALAFNTVMTVMNRLVDKGLLHRLDRRRNYKYRPAIRRDEFLARVSRDVARALLADFGEVAVAQFLHVLEEVNPARLAELERRLAGRRAVERRRGR